MPRTFRLSLVLMTVATVAAVAVPARAQLGNSPTDPLPVDPGTGVRSGGLSLVGHAEPECETATVSSGADSGLVPVRLAADVRPLVRNETEPRDASFVPNLDVTWRITERASGERFTGALTFAHSGHGPHYEATTELPASGVFDMNFVFEGTASSAPGALEGLETLRSMENWTWTFALGNAGVPAGLNGQAGPEGDSAAQGAPVTLPGCRPDPNDPTDPPGQPETAITPVNLRMALLGTLDPVPADSYSDIWGYHDSQGHLAIMGTTTGTSFIDVTDPANPIQKAFIGGPSSSWRDIKTYQNYAYIVTEGGGGMQIVDVSDFNNITLVNTYNSTFSSCHNLYIDVPEGIGYAVGTNNSTRIFDLACGGCATNPVEVGSWTLRYVHDAYARDGRAYFAEINNGIHEILDNTDKANLQVLATWNTPKNNAHNSWANDTGDLVVTTDEVSAGGFTAIYDTSNLSNVVELGGFQPSTSTSVHNAFFDDDDNELVYMSHYAIGQYVIDLHRPTAPVEIGHYDTYSQGGQGDGGFNGAWGSYPFDPRGYVYTSDISNGLYVFDLAPTGGTLSGIVRDKDTAQPIPNADVTVLANSENIVTGPDGVYALYAEAGPVQVRAAAYGFSSQFLDAGSMPLGGRVDADLELTKLPVQVLQGTVTRSDTSAPLDNVTLRLLGSQLEATTDGSGFYSFSEVPIGTQTLLVERFGFDRLSKRFVVGGGGTIVQDLALDPAPFADDAEGDLGWSLGIPGDPITSAGQGRWERDDPNATAGGAAQPEDDNTPTPGVTAFITAQSPVGAQAENNDVDGGPTTLVSPTIDLSAPGEYMVSFHRWLSRNAGAINSGTLLTQISNNDGGSWVTVENLTSNVPSWTKVDFDVASILAPTNQMRLRFRASSSASFPNFSVTEAAVDDVEVINGCNHFFNAEASDSDSDNVNDGCDACPFDPLNDQDGDSLCGNADNSPFVANAGQGDGDGDGIGDASDNCSGVSNVRQRDLDGNGQGDLCDGDIDGDSVANASDTDDDNDGVPDVSDICPNTPDPQQEDRDADLQGDACDFDDGLITGVRMDGDLLTWEIEDGSDGYNVYRGDLGHPALLVLASCRGTGLDTAFTSDDTLPKPDEGFFYLVARTVSGSEGPLGDKSDGSPRVLNGTCD